MPNVDHTIVHLVASLYEISWASLLKTPKSIAKKIAIIDKNKVQTIM